MKRFDLGDTSEKLVVLSFRCSISPGVAQYPNVVLYCGTHAQVVLGVSFGSANGLGPIETIALKILVMVCKEELRQYQTNYEYETIIVDY